MRGRIPALLAALLLCVGLAGCNPAAAAPEAGAEAAVTPALREVSGQRNAEQKNAEQESAEQGNTVQESAEQGNAVRENGENGGGDAVPENVPPEGTVQEELRYAREFSLHHFPNGCTMAVINGDRFLIVPEGGTVPEGVGEDTAVLYRPLTELYLAASSAMDFFRRLDALDAVRFTSTSAANWSLPEVRAALEAKTILYAGKYSAPDFELLLSAGCPLAVESTMIYHSPDIREKLETLGIPVLVERSSYETHPLGRMEWIKLYGVLAGREAEAAAFFDAQTEALTDVLTAESTRKTAAFFSLSSNGYATVRKPGDYVTKMMELAGGQYAFADAVPKEENALSTMNLQMELFFAGAKEADILIYNGTIDGGVRTLPELLGKSALLADCKAVQNGDVWCTEQNLFQETTAAAGVIAELHGIFTGTAEEPLTYFHRLR